MTTEPQPEFFEKSEVESNVLQSLETGEMGRYTLERIKKQKPELYRAAERMLQAGFGIRETARALALAPRTIMAIRDYERISISTLKQELSAGFAKISALCHEAMVDRLTDQDTVDKIPFRDLAVGAGISSDHVLKCNDQATIRIAHELAAPDHEELAAYLQDLQTGLSAGNPAQKGPAEQPAIDITPEVETTRTTMDTDTQSDD